MSTIKLVIPHTPRPKGSVKSANKHFYNPSARGMKQLRDFVSQELEGTDFKPFKGPLLVICHYRIPAPLAASPSARRRMHNLPHTKRPDGDNLEKFLNDSLNGILWQDDSQIAWVLRSKSMTYSRVGETILFVRELDAEQENNTQIITDINAHIECGE